MKIDVKPLKGETFSVEIDGSQKIADIKQKIAEDKPDQYGGGQTLKMIYSGKILNDDQVIQDVGIKEGEFVVVMAQKAKTPAAAPAAAPASAPAPTPASAPAPAAPDSGGPAPMDMANSNVVSNSGMEGTITQLMGMGFDRAQVERCLQAAFNNPDRATEYLLEGIPEGLMSDAPGGGGAGGAPAPAPPAGRGAPMGAATGGYAGGGGGGGGGTPSPMAFPQIPPAGAAGGGGGGGAGGPLPPELEQIRNNPMFQQLAGMLQQNPGMLDQILPALEQSNPGLVAAIQANPEAFRQMLAGAGQGGGPQVDPMDPVAVMLAAAPPGGGGGGGAPPGQNVVRLTQEESDAVDRLTQLGFDRQTAAQAYLACDKNEELAANFLFENGADMMQD